MYIADDGTIEGTVTGGCVEAALFEEANEVLAGGEPRLMTYGISDDIAAGVGLMCGGTVRVLVSTLDGAAGEVHAATMEEAAAGRPAALATLVDGPSAGAKLAIIDDRVEGGFGGAEKLDRAVERDARGALSEAVSLLRYFGEDGRQTGSDLRVWIETFATAPRLIILGAIDYSVAVARMARLIGFETTICDAREPFVKSSRFSAVAEVVVDWPDRYLQTQELTERDAILVFTHDRKFDEPALKVALSGAAGYVGAMGSRRTQADRADRLREGGVSEAELERLAAPCGLDIGARTPSETALSILAEIVALRADRGGQRLVDASGSIRGRVAAPELPGSQA
jgi:xanthine dehydrogenase accessory factor